MPHAAGILALSLACVALFTPSAPAQCAQWQTGLGAPGFDGPVLDSLRFDDGSGAALYVCGSFTTAPGTIALNVARWNGTTWSPVGAGVVGGLTSMTVFDDGSGPRLYAAGLLGALGTGGGGIVRWDGSQWTPYTSLLNTAGGSDEVPWCITGYDDGSGSKLYVGGGFPGCVARWNGTSWAVVGGGIANSPFDIPATVKALSVFDDGTGFALYAGGAFQTVSNPSVGPNIARYSGGTWTTVAGGLGSGWGDEVSALEVYDDGNGRKLVAGGRFVPNVGPTTYLSRLENGVWTPFPADVDGPVYALLAVDLPSSTLPQGLWVGGTFEHVGATPAHDLAVWSGASWSAVGAGSAQSWVRTLGRFDLGSGPRVFAGSHGGAAQSFDGTSWSSMGGANGALGTVMSFTTARTSSGQRELFAAGEFTSFGGQVADGIARFDGETWHGENLAGPTTLRWKSLWTIDLGAGDEVYAVGRFDGYAPGWTNIVQRVGGVWVGLPRIPAVGSETPGGVFAFDSGSGRTIHVGMRAGIYRLDGSTWKLILSGGGNSSFLDAIVVDEGSGPVVYLAGFLGLVGGVSCGSIARWDGTTVTNLNGGTSAGGSLWDIAFYDDGSGPKLYAAGTITTIGGVACENVARWDGTTWSPLGAGLGTGFTIATSLDVHDDHTGFGPELVVGGYFSTAGGQPVNRLARWNGTTWREPTGGVAHATEFPRVFDLEPFDRGDGRGPALFVGGLFQSAGGVGSNNIAVWESCNGDASTFCYGDGTSAACPCGNASAPGSRAGCLNSLGSGGTLRVSGHASLTHDTLVLEGGGMGNSIGLYFQGGNAILGGAGVAFGDGLRCLAGPYVRFPAQASINGVSRYPGPTNPNVSTVGQVLVPGTHRYQIWYRDSAAFCTSSTFTYTNALEVAWGP